MFCLRCACYKHSIGSPAEFWTTRLTSNAYLTLWHDITWKWLIVIKAQPKRSRQSRHNFRIWKSLRSIHCKSGKCHTWSKLEWNNIRAKQQAPLQHPRQRCRRERLLWLVRSYHQLQHKFGQVCFVIKLPGMVLRKEVLVRVLEEIWPQAIRQEQKGRLGCNPWHTRCRVVHP